MDPENKNPLPPDEEPLTPGPKKKPPIDPYFWKHRVEFLIGALMFIGLVLSFFFLYLGGFLVGLAAGICFSREIEIFFLRFKEGYGTFGLFKTLIAIGAILYLLFSVPTFILGIAAGYGFMILIRKAGKKRG